MKKFLLSNGGFTYDVMTYIKDQIKLAIQVPKNSIPRFKFGSERVIPEFIDSEAVDKIRDNIIDTINSIDASQVGVSISVRDIAIKDRTVNVSLQINNDIISYSIS